MNKAMEAVRALLGDMAADDYVRFKYGKRVDQAIKALDKIDGGPDLAEVEARLAALLDLVKGGAGTSGPKSPKSPRKPRAAAAPAAGA